MNKYPEEVLNVEWEEDNGTMPANVKTLEEAVVGHKIVSAEPGKAKGFWGYNEDALVLTLDNGRKVSLVDTSDCCAYTDLKEFLLHPEMVDHVIMGVGTTDRYTKWHIYADFGDIMELTVGWSCGNPFYYGYGFEITVEDIHE